MVMEGGQSADETALPSRQPVQRENTRARRARIAASSAWRGIIERLRFGRTSKELRFQAYFGALNRDFFRRGLLCRCNCMIVEPGVPRRSASGAIYEGRAFLLLRVTNPVRRRAIDLVEWKWFDRAVLLLIVVSCVFMATEDPLATEEQPYQTVSDWVFTVLFSLEMLIKCTAMGILPFESRAPFASDPWNDLDGLIVLLSWVSLLGSRGSASSGFSALRAVRVLRPLRTISHVRGMRLLVQSFLASLPKTADVLILFGFFLLTFAIVGVHLFQGRLHYRCFEGDGTTVRFATRDPSPSEVLIQATTHSVPVPVPCPYVFAFKGNHLL